MINRKGRRKGSNRMRFSLTFITIVLTVMIFNNIGWTQAVCRDCGVDGRDCMHENSSLCIYGGHFNSCKVYKCFRGPDDMCNNKYQCAKGLTCNPCGRCSGCVRLGYLCSKLVCSKSRMVPGDYY